MSWLTVLLLRRLVLKLPDASGSHLELPEASELFSDCYKATSCFWKLLWFARSYWTPFKTVLKLPDASRSHLDLPEASELFLKPF